MATRTKKFISYTILTIALVACFVAVFLILDGGDNVQENEVKIDLLYFCAFALDVDDCNDWANQYYSEFPDNAIRCTERHEQHQLDEMTFCIGSVLGED